MKAQFTTDFNMTTEIDLVYFSEWMSESDAFFLNENGFYETELDNIQITSRTTATIWISDSKNYYSSGMEIDLDGIIDEDSDENIEDFIMVELD
jgi:hypothetical protein